MPNPIQPTNPEVAMPENSSDLEAQVVARAAAIEAKVADKLPAPPAETKLDKGFVLDCLNRNKVGDAALFCALFRGKYVFVQEWEKFLYWAGHYWEVDVRSMKALADSECEAASKMRMRRKRNENVPQRIFCFGTFFDLNLRQFGVGKLARVCRHLILAHIAMQRI